jgi:hypothetical protein
MLYKDNNRKGSVEKKYWSGSQEVCRQYELIGGKQAVVK